MMGRMTTRTMISLLLDSYAFLRVKRVKRIIRRSLRVRDIPIAWEIYSRFLLPNRRFSEVEKPCEYSTNSSPPILRPYFF